MIQYTAYRLISIEFPYRVNAENLVQFNRIDLGTNFSDFTISISV